MSRFAGAGATPDGPVSGAVPGDGQGNGQGKGQGNGQGKGQGNGSTARRATLAWTAPALDDLDDIAAWIADSDPVAAAKLVQGVMAAVERLRASPLSGRRVPEAPGGLYREVAAAVGYASARR